MELDPARPLPGIAAAARAIQEGALSPTGLLEATLARAEALEPRLHAFITIAAEPARAAAEQAGRELRAGYRRGRLHGVPYGVKDIYDAAGLPTTAHSRLRPPRPEAADSDAVSRLNGAGMVLVGKLSTHEFAIGGPSPELPYPCATNPWHAGHFAGGSSSGSGVAVASGVLPLAMGSDTGGSIRLPAAYSGSVGLKPSYGRLSRRGIIPLSFTMDHAGPLTKTVEDCALAMQVLAGHDPADPGSATVPVGDYLSGLEAGVAGLRIGYARAFGEEVGVGEEEMQALDAAAEALAKLGAIVEPIRLPALVEFEAAGWTVLHAEAFAVHAHDLRARPELYARTTRERLLMGAFTTGPEVIQASRLRHRLQRQVDRLLQEYDAILIAPIHGPAAALEQVDDGPLRVQRPLTILFNTTGHPALCMPCGFSRSGLPLSLQLAGRMFDEATVLRVAHAYEQATGWHLEWPSLTQLAETMPA